MVLIILLLCFFVTVQSYIPYNRNENTSGRKRRLLFIIAHMPNEEEFEKKTTQVAPVAVARNRPHDKYQMIAMRRIMHGPIGKRSYSSRSDHFVL